MFKRTLTIIISVIFLFSKLVKIYPCLKLFYLWVSQSPQVDQTYLNRFREHEILSSLWGVHSRVLFQNPSIIPLMRLDGSDKGRIWVTFIPSRGKGIDKRRAESTSEDEVSFPLIKIFANTLNSDSHSQASPDANYTVHHTVWFTL